LCTDSRVLDVVRRCDDSGLSVDVVPRLFELVGPRYASTSIGAVPLISVRGRRRGHAESALKRAIDILGSSGVLILTSPLLAVGVALVWLNDRGPILYRQQRIGRGGKPFTILKLRTMVRDADAVGQRRLAALGNAASIDQTVAALKPRDDPRITRVGRWLRRSSIDELPQLLNVLRGDMSLVGPRPLRDFELEALDGWERTRLVDRPGITGLWQISGRSTVSWEERMLMDYSYVRHWSLVDDIGILAKTLAAVIGGRGAT
jgi:exopolysaccharide biosynthesis polyprenyl glycosylphosphotransferase